MSKSRDLADLVSAGNIFADGNIDVSELTGVLGVAAGGTGLSASGTSGNILVSNGSAWESAANTAASTGKAIAMAIVFG